MIVLADRGFGRAALAAFLRRQGFSYLIRVKPKVTVKAKGFHGKLLDYPVRKGVAKVLRDAAYRADGAVTQHAVVRWKPGLPPKRDECWFLVTDLSGTAHQLCALYARRMTIGQLFRDGKSKRNGWALRDTQLKTPQRLDRLLLVLAIAYLLLCGLGLIAQATRRPAGRLVREQQGAVQHLPHRPDHADQDHGKPAPGLRRRPRPLTNHGAELGMTQETPRPRQGKRRRAMPCGASRKPRAESAPLRRRYREPEGALPPAA